MNSGNIRDVALHVRAVTVLLCEDCPDSNLASSNGLECVFSFTLGGEEGELFIAAQVSLYAGLIQ